MPKHMKFEGRPKVPLHDRLSAKDVLARLEQGLSVEQLQILCHAVAVSRECSRYCAWDEAEVEAVLSVIDAQLLPSKRLSVLPFWLQDTANT